MCNEGLGLHDQGRLEEARACYKKVLLRDPKHFNATCLLGLICRQTGKPELAVALFRRAIGGVRDAAAMPAPMAAAYNNLGLALRDLARHEEALANHDRAIALQPGLGEAHGARGALLLAMGRPDQIRANPAVIEAYLGH